MPAVTVVGAIRFFVDLYERVAQDLGAVAARHTIDVNKTIASGTGADQADLAWSDERTVAAGTPDDLDLAGVLASALNAGIVFKKISGIVIRNKSTTSGQTLALGGAAANQFFSGIFGAAPHTLTIGPGGAAGWYSPIDAAVVTAGTGDILRVTSASGSVVYQIVIIGRTV